MMSTKFSTQGWSKAVQNHDFGEDHQRRYTSATAGGSDATGGKKEQAVGDILNQVANPSGKDMSGHQVRRAHNTLDKDDFLKLMLTQMKNQDPMNPMQSHEMAAQLAQFTSLEQLFNVNKNLETLGSKQDPLAKFEALNFLGKAIKSDTRQIFHSAGDTANELRFNLGADTTKVTVKISDEFGQPVKEIETSGLNKGLAKVVWNGTDNRDREAKPGKYSFSVEAVNQAGQKVAVQTETTGVVTGVNYTPEGPLLMVGDQKVKLADVQRIEDGQLKELQSARESKPMQAPVQVPAMNPMSPENQEGVESAPKSNDLSKLEERPLQGMQEYQKAVMKSKPEERLGAKMGDVSMPVEATTTSGGGEARVADNSGKKLGGAFGRRY